VRARQARERLLGAYGPGGEAPQVSAWEQEVWESALAAYLTSLFAAKCAFCEGTEADAGQCIKLYHFRPIDGFTAAGPPPEPHPGYYWLAYEWYNLLPACGGCAEHGRLAAGRPDRFPVIGWPVSRMPEDPVHWRDVHEDEEPLLLDPYSRYQFEADLTFLIDTGHVYGLTERGRETIKRFDLNRPRLLKARLLHKKIEQIRNLYRIASSQPVVEPPPSAPFSAWLRFCARQRPMRVIPSVETALPDANSGGPGNEREAAAIARIVRSGHSPALAGLPIRPDDEE
jgi:hypothetical protein